MVETPVSPVTQLSVGDCWELLRANVFGRLALSVSNQPEIFPLNYVVQGDTFLFRTAQGTKLAALTVNESVALEIDGHDATGGWSVIAKGSAQATEWGEDFNAAQVAELHPWIPTGKPVFVRITPGVITGRRFVFGPEPENT